MLKLHLTRANSYEGVYLQLPATPAEIVNALGLDECRLLEGALNAESVSGLDDVITIGERLNQYLLIPHATNDRELGIYLVITGVMPFDGSVRPYLDYVRIGVEYYANHGGAYTDGGYVVRRDSVEQALIDTVQVCSEQINDSMQMG